MKGAQPKDNNSDTTCTYTRLRPDVKNALVRIALKENRSLSNLIGWVLERWLQEQGELNP